MKNIARKIRSKIHADLYPIYSDKAMRKSEISWWQNQAMINQDFDWTYSKVYQYFKAIHRLMELNDIIEPYSQLVRVGKMDDGGYIMVNPYSNADIAYSIGISDDVSWDREMVNRGYEVYQYDHTIDALPEENEHFHWERLGLSGQPDLANRMDTLGNVMKKNGHENLGGGVLKMDIEGYEWDVLETVDEKVLKGFDQIIMEMHWLFSMGNNVKILKCLEKLSKTHALVHVHGTNFEPVYYCKDLITPDCIEVTFVNKDKFTLKRSDKILPIDIDRPCWSETPDILLGRWNLE